MLFSGSILQKQKAKYEKKYRHKSVYEQKPDYDTRHKPEPKHNNFLNKVFIK
jgi:hypothetical protein